MQPVLTQHLFLPLQVELTTLLRGLAPEDWARPTIAGSWRVKDVVAHILDGDLRRLSMHRDGYSRAKGAMGPEGYDGLVAFLNDLNATWVKAAERLSPALLIDLLEWAGPQVSEFFLSLPPDGTALLPVDWAGEERSTNWMDVSRDYTEKWHHQAQIRDAVGAPPLFSRKWLGPVLELSMYALPRAFQSSNAPVGSVLSITVEGEAGGRWFLIRRADGWRLSGEQQPQASASARMDADTAWRLFFNGLNREEAERRIERSGDPDICSTLLSARAVMV